MYSSEEVESLSVLSLISDYFNEFEEFSLPFGASGIFHLTSPGACQRSSNENLRERVGFMRLFFLLQFFPRKLEWIFLLVSNCVPFVNQISSVQCFVNSFITSSCCCYEKLVKIPFYGPLCEIPSLFVIKSRVFMNEIFIGPSEARSHSYGDPILARRCKNL